MWKRPAGKGTPTTNPKHSIGLVPQSLFARIPSDSSKWVSADANGVRGAHRQNVAMFYSLPKKIFSLFAGEWNK